MYLVSASQCEAAIPIGEATRQVFRECMQTVASGSAYHYEPGLLSSVSGFIIFAVIIWLALTAVLIGVVLSNNNLTSRQKLGYSLGVVCVPVLFFPLYLILSPESEKSDKGGNEDKLLGAMTFRKEAGPVDTKPVVP